MNLIEEIESALNNNNCTSVERYRYALYSTLTTDELSQLCFEYINDSNIRNRIIKHFLAKIRHTDEVINESFKNQLLHQFIVSTGKTRVSIGAIIRELKTIFSKEQLSLFFYEQIKSNKVSDRKRAYSVASDIYDKDIEENLWQSWRSYHDKSCIRVLIEEISLEQLSSKFESLWNDKEIDQHIKNYILKKVASYNFQTVSFLKENHPIAYLGACLTAKQKVSDEYCLRAIHSAQDFDSFGYILWCIGTLGRRNILVSIKDELKDIESRLKNHWDCFNINA